MELVDGAMFHGCELLFWEPLVLAMMTSLSRDPGELSAGKENPGPTLSIFEQMESNIIAIAMVP